MLLPEPSHLRDPDRFPQHARLAAVAESLKAGTALLDYLASIGVHLCATDDGQYVPVAMSRNEILTGWAGIDFHALTEEMRDLAILLRQEETEQARVQAAAPLYPLTPET